MNKQNKSSYNESELSSLIRAAYAETEPKELPQGLSARLDAAIRAEAEKPEFTKKRIPSKIWIPAAALAACALIGIGIAFSSSLKSLDVCDNGVTEEGVIEEEYTEECAEENEEICGNAVMYATFGAEESEEVEYEEGAEAAEEDAVEEYCVTGGVGDLGELADHYYRILTCGQCVDVPGSIYDYSGDGYTIPVYTRAPSILYDFDEYVTVKCEGKLEDAVSWCCQAIGRGLEVYVIDDCLRVAGEAEKVLNFAADYVAEGELASLAGAEGDLGLELSFED